MKVIIKELGTYEYPKETSRRRRVVTSRCNDCLKEKTQSYDSFIANVSKECIHCAMVRKNTKHGGCSRENISKLYRVWVNMKSRCYNKNNTHYKNYGAKGVTICKEWLNDFKSFETWALLNGWNDSLTIDKDKLSKELGIVPPLYSPKTCTFMSMLEQSKYKNGLRRNNKTGIENIHYHKRDKCYEIYSGGKYMGRRKTLEEAKVILKDKKDG